MPAFKQFARSFIPAPVGYQTTCYSCGAACLRIVCKLFGVGPEDEDEFIAACKTTKADGTEPEALAAAARSFGLKTLVCDRMTLDELRALIDAKRPVICAIQAWGDDDYADNDDGHYVVAIGHDDDHVLFQDPSIKNNRRGRLTHADFEKRWHDVDKDGRVRRHLGIVLWRDGGADEVDFDSRASRISKEACVRTVFNIFKVLLHLVVVVIFGYYNFTHQQDQPWNGYLAVATSLCFLFIGLSMALTWTRKPPPKEGPHDARRVLPIDRVQDAAPAEQTRP